MREREGASVSRARHGALAAALCGALLATLALGAPAAQGAFGFQSVELGFTQADGSRATQAGSHPFAWTTSLSLNTSGVGEEERPEGSLKDLRIGLPPGLIGTPALLPHCSRAEFSAQSCPADSEVGEIALHTGSEETAGRAFQLYNLEPLSGNVAELGFTAVVVPVIIELQIAAAPPYNVIAEITNVSQAAAFFGSVLTIRGVPGPAPFLTLPRSCGAAPALFEADQWSAPGAWVGATAPPLEPSGCAKLSFLPTLRLRPSTDAANAPTGLDLSLDLANEGLVSPTGIANADLAAASFELAPGMAINPPLAAGLAACSPAELARERPDSEPGTGCPQAAKIGTASATSPLLDAPLAGDVYVATPDAPATATATATAGAENPFDARFALYLVLRDLERGVLISLPIALEADPASGRLKTRVGTLPQLPFTHLELRFNSGPHAPLSTPSGCGLHAISYSLTPSSGAPPFARQESFATSSNCEARFAPRLEAGTTPNAAGAAAPFVFELAGPAASAELQSLGLTLPPGLAVDLSAATTCPEADAAAAGCPSSSRLGYARIALGTGPEPLWVPPGAEPDSAVYLAGPYQGGSFSLLISVHALAGPYDFGRVVLRAPVRIDPDTAQASIALSGLPRILAGVPLRYRAIRVVLDRPGFIRNPTSCAPLEITGTALARDGLSAPLAERFQAADCAALPFKPRLAVSLSGALARNGRPAIRAVIKANPGGANIARAALSLPATELLEYANIRAVCTASIYAAGGGGGERCSPASRYGRARVFTPLFDHPLEGPLYLRANNDPRRLPDLIASLDGAGTHLDFAARISSTHGLLRLSFEGLPDLPAEKVVLRLPGGRRGLLVNTVDLCRGRPRVVAAFLAHNRKRAEARSSVNLKCAPSTPSG